MLPERRTGTTLGDMQLRSGPAQCRHADARGLEVSPSSFLQNELVKRQTETALRSRLFSSSSSFSRFTCLIFSPPNSWRQLMGWTALPPARRLRACNRKENCNDY